MKEWPISERLSLRGCWRRMGRGTRGAGLISLLMVLAVGVVQGSGKVPDDGWIVGLAGVIWAVAVAVAASLPAGGYLVAGLWLGWHGLAMMGAWTGTPLVALPVMWWLWTGLAVLAWRGPRHAAARGMIQGAMALWAGYLLAGPAGWHRLPGKAGEMIWVGRLGIGCVIALGGWWLLPRMRKWDWTNPEFDRIWVGGLVVMGVGLGTAMWRDAEASTGWAGSVLEACRWFGVMGWFWAGGLFGVGLVGLLEKAKRPLLGNWILPAVWLGVTVMEWLATHEGTQPWAARLPGELGSWMAGWSSGWQKVAKAHAWVGVVVVVLGVGFLWQGKGQRPGEVLRRLNVVWAVALAALVLVVPALPGGTGAETLTSGWGLPLLLAVGWVAAAGRLIREGVGPSKGSDPGPWGIMVMAVGLLLAGWIMDGTAWPETGSVAALLGMIHLSVPLLLYGWWTGNQPAGEKLAFSTQGWVMALGLLGVLPLLHRDAVTVSQMAFCPVWWFAVLVGLRLRSPRLDTAAGTLAGALLGSATVAAWCRPWLLLPEVPVLSWLNPPVLASGMDLPARPYLDAPHFTLLLLMTGAGALLGATIFRGKTADGLPVMPLLTDPAEAIGAPFPQR